MGATNLKIESAPQRASDPVVGAVAISYGGGDQTFTQNPRGVYIGTAGHLKVDLIDGSTAITFSNLAAGQIYPFAITKIYQSGSTAAGVALL